MKVARSVLAAFCVALLAAVPGAFAADANTVEGTVKSTAEAEAKRTAATDRAAPTTATEEAIETTRRSARSSAEWLARGVDGWFGDTPFEDGGKVSDGRFNVGLYKRRDQSAHLDVRFNAHFRLPNVEKNAYLFIGRDDPREVIQDTPNAVAGQQRLLTDRPGDRSFLGGLGLSVRKALDLRIGFGARLKPYLQARYDKPWAVGDGQVIDFRQTLFWSQADRFGVTTALSYEVAVTPSLVGRWLNAATITQTTKNVAWSSTLGAYQAMGDQRLLTLELLANGTGHNGSDNSPDGSSDLGVLVKWEQALYKSWLLGELVAGHFWPRPDATSPRGRAWALGAGLKMKF